MQCPRTDIFVPGAQPDSFADPSWKRYTELCEQAGFTAVRSLDETELTDTDALIVVDMQNDFLPLELPVGGRFSVPGGGFVAATIVDLIDRFSNEGGVVAATRDYHPAGHVSFIECGGRFPVHCVQGSVGSEFYPPIKEALRRARTKAQDKVKVAFKGFHEDIDSFGAFTYTAKDAQTGGFPKSIAADEQDGHRVARRCTADSAVQVRPSC